MHRKLLEAGHDTGGTLISDLIIVVGLVLIGGVMSGLTLGLMSLDTLDMEVLKRSGTPKERLYASRIAPVLRNPHWTLVTLLLCNAAALEALPIFLDKIVSPVLAILLSVTAVLLFGEIIPQAACKSYALIIGAHTAWLVRILRVLVGVISWPIAKVLDWVLGAEHTALFRRAQLKALVNMHSIDESFGGHLTAAEIGIIGGALDLTHKTAAQGMTPLDKVFALPADAILNVETLKAVLGNGHSRVPVHAPGNRAQILGLLLVKELILVDQFANLPISTQRIRSIPHLRADTAMYDLLKLFSSGRTHMVVLTRPPAESAAALAAEQAADAIRDGVPPEDLPNLADVLPLASGQLKEAHLEGSVKGSRTQRAKAKLQEKLHRGSTVSFKDILGAEETPRSTDGSSQMNGSQMSAASHTRLTVNIEPEVMQKAAEAAHPGSMNSRTWSTLDTAHANPEDTLGIVTIEDVIEELLGQEIVDETDRFRDNLQTTRVHGQARLAQASPRVRALLTQYTCGTKELERAFSVPVPFMSVQASDASMSGDSEPSSATHGSAPVQGGFKALPPSQAANKARRHLFKSSSARQIRQAAADHASGEQLDAMERQVSTQSTSAL